MRYIPVGSIVHYGKPGDVLCGSDKRVRPGYSIFVTESRGAVTCTLCKQQLARRRK